MKKKPGRRPRKTIRRKKRDPRATARIADRAGWLANAERGRTPAASREAHLRSLMGLPAKPSRQEPDRANADLDEA
jgi:hypothetical protein